MYTTPQIMACIAGRNQPYKNN